MTAENFLNLIRTVDGDKRLKGQKFSNFSDSFKYAEMRSKIIGELIEQNILDLDDRETACLLTLKEQYAPINSVCGQVQRSLDRKTGLNLTPQKSEFPLERVQTFAHSLTDPTVPDETIQRRARSGTENITLSFHDGYIEENAKFRTNAGVKCYITRTTDGKCCSWCSSMAGRYEYGKEPSDIYRRHDNCTCSVTFENGRERQNVWSKRKWEVKNEFQPKVFSRQQAERIQSQHLNFRGLTNGENSDILRSNGNGIQQTEHTYEKIGEIDFNDKKAVAKSLQEFEQKYENSRIEHCRVICPNGEIYEVHGDLDTVDTSVLGEKLKGSINEHNHVTGESQYSFSWDDLRTSFYDGSKIVMAYDEKYRYSMIFPDYNLDFDEVYQAYFDSYNEIGDINSLSYQSGKGKQISDEHFQHEVIRRACERLGIKYERKVKA